MNSSYSAQEMKMFGNGTDFIADFADHNSILEGFIRLLQNEAVRWVDHLSVYFGEEIQLFESGTDLTEIFNDTT